MQHRDVQRIADDLLSEGRDPSTIRNALMPLRVIFRRAVENGDLAVNPRAHLRLPAVRGRRERIASPQEAEQLLAARPAHDRPIWATALYAGLRRGELMARRWEDVDLANGVIHVERACSIRIRCDSEDAVHTVALLSHPVLGLHRKSTIVPGWRRYSRPGLAADEGRRVAAGDREGHGRVGDRPVSRSVGGPGRQHPRPAGSQVAS